MTCRFIVYAVAGPPYAGSGISGISHAVARCETHGMDNAVVVDGLCAFGQIEKKLDQVIAKFEDAMTQMMKAMP